MALLEAYLAIVFIGIMLMWSQIDNIKGYGYENAIQKFRERVVDSKADIEFYSHYGDRRLVLYFVQADVNLRVGVDFEFLINDDMLSMVLGALSRVLEAVCSDPLDVKRESDYYLSIFSLWEEHFEGAGGALNAKERVLTLECTAANSKTMIKKGLHGFAERLRLSSQSSAGKEDMHKKCIDISVRNNHTAHLNTGTFKYLIE